MFFLWPHLEKLKLDCMDFLTEYILLENILHIYQMIFKKEF